LNIDGEIKNNFQNKLDIEMDKEALKKVVLEILGSENEETFSEFLKSIADHLHGGKTLKLNGIGHFQLKKEPLSRMERRSEGSVSDIIIFLPENESTEEKLLSFKVENPAANNGDFTDSVFDIGVNRKTIISDSVTEDEDSESKILKLIEGGNIFEDFDILNNPDVAFPSIESDDIKGEQIEYSTENIIDDKIEDEVLEELDDKMEEGSVKESDETMGVEFSEEIGDIIDDEVIEKLDNNLEELGDDVEEKIIEEIDEELNAEISEELDDSQLDDRVTVVEINRDFLNDSEEEILDEQLGNTEMGFKENDIEDEQNHNDFEEISSNSKTKITIGDVTESEISKKEEKVFDNDDDKNPFDELDDFIKEDAKHEDEEGSTIRTSESFENGFTESRSDNITNEKGETKMKPSSYSELRNKSNEWYKSPMLIISIIVVVVGTFAIFYFWDSISNSTNGDVSQVEELNSDQAIIDSTKNADTTKTTSVQLTKLDQTTGRNESGAVKADDKNESVQKKVKSVMPSSSALYRDIPNDQAIAERIFFDGNKYTVQSSSWKSTKIAEQEANKLIKRGFDAFIFKVFIKSKGSTWHRVRIGYFDTRTEAAEFLKKNKI
jgi:SPOR domain